MNLASFINGYQDGAYRDSFWIFYLPVDFAGEYKLQDDMNIIFKTSVQMPIYTGTAETLFVGIGKGFRLVLCKGNNRLNFLKGLAPSNKKIIRVRKL